MNKKALIVSILAVFFLSSASVLAQSLTPPQDFVPLTTIDGLFTAGEKTNPVKLLSGIYGFAIGIGAVIAVLMIIFGGFEYMYQESIGSKSAAKERITNAFLGLGVILASFIILRTINADLVDFNLHLPGASGQLSGLMDSRAELDNAIAGVRNAQKEVAVLKGEITTLDGQISIIEASSTMSAADKAVAMRDLNTKKAVKVAQEALVRNNASTQAAIASINNYVSETKDGLTIVPNVEGAIARGKAAFSETQSALNGAYLLTQDQRYKDLETENAIKSEVFETNSSQLLLLAQYKEKSWIRQAVVEDEEGIGAKIRQIGEAGASRMRALGRAAEAEKIEKDTAIRVKIVCSKCI